MFCTDIFQRFPGHSTFFFSFTIHKQDAKALLPGSFRAPGSSGTITVVMRGLNPVIES